MTIAALGRTPVIWESTNIAAKPTEYEIRIRASVFKSPGTSLAVMVLVWSSGCHANPPAALLVPRRLEESNVAAAGGPGTFLITDADVPVARLQ